MRKYLKGQEKEFSMKSNKTFVPMLIWFLNLWPCLPTTYLPTTYLLPTYLLPTYYLPSTYYLPTYLLPSYL